MNWTDIFAIFAICAIFAAITWFVARTVGYVSGCNESDSSRGLEVEYYRDSYERAARLAATYKRISNELCSRCIVLSNGCDNCPCNAGMRDDRCELGRANEKSDRIGLHNFEGR